MDLTPHVMVHQRKQDFSEKKLIVDRSVIIENYRVDFADEELFEIERLVDEIPEFVEVQPDRGEEEESVPQFEEVAEESKEGEELPKWEPVSEENQDQSLVVEEDQDLKKTIKKFEPIESVKKTEEEKTEAETPVEPSEDKKEFDAIESKTEIWDESEHELPSEKQSGSSVWEPINNKKMGVNLKKKAEIFKVFASVNHIDQNTALLLYHHDIKTMEDLRKTSLESLKDIDGINDEKAEHIFHEINQDRENTSSEDELKKEEPSSHQGSEGKASDAKHEKPYRYGAYSLYEKEISIGDDKNRIVHFFSKNPPEDSKPSFLPPGYEVKVNRKTGVPFIKKIR